MCLKIHFIKNRQSDERSIDVRSDSLELRIGHYIHSVRQMKKARRSAGTGIIIGIRRINGKIMRWPAM